MATTEHTTGGEATTQVLKFSLGEQDYCVDIEYVQEILDGGTLTTVPSTEEYIEGVMDLRGQTTTIVSPEKIMEAENVDPSELVADGGEAKTRIIMLESSVGEGETPIGWLVSAVSDVTEFSTETLEAEGITDEPMFEGVVSDTDGYTIWLDPTKMLE